MSLGEKIQWLSSRVLLTDLKDTWDESTKRVNFQRKLKYLGLLSSQYKSSQVTSKPV